MVFIMIDICKLLILSDYYAIHNVLYSKKCIYMEDCIDDKYIIRNNRDFTCIACIFVLHL